MIRTILNVASRLRTPDPVLDPVTKNARYDDAQDWLWELARTPCAGALHVEALMKLL